MCSANALSYNLDCTGVQVQLSLVQRVLHVLGTAACLTKQTSQEWATPACTCLRCKAPASLLLRRGVELEQCMAMQARDAPSLLQRRQRAASPQRS